MKKRGKSKPKNRRRKPSQQTNATAIPELGERVWEDNGHRWTWIHPKPQRGRCVCVDCEYVRCFPIRRAEEPVCGQKKETCRIAVSPSRKQIH